MNWLKRFFGRFRVDEAVGVPAVSEADFADFDSWSGLGFGLFEGSGLYHEAGGRSVDESVLDWLDEVDDRRLRR
ncbi:MAG: hypothetical protein ACKVQS_04550 [Fimbriimonadaceae bacterium]